MWPNTENIRSKRFLFYERKFYRVLDNSFQECLSDGTNYHLAGGNGDVGQTVEIIRGPYNKIVMLGGRQHEFQFIVGKCVNGRLHEIIFHQAGLRDTSEQDYNFLPLYSI